MTTLFTIGYATHTPASLFNKLESTGVKLLLDVRELPLSRRKGFSKSALASAAAERGIEYRHVKALGVPAAMRHSRREGGIEADGYMESFRSRLREMPDVLSDSLALVAGKPACLLCLESRPADCHRTIVAEELVRIAEGGILIVHL